MRIKRKQQREIVIETYLLKENWGKLEIIAIFSRLHYSGTVINYLEDNWMKQMLTNYYLIVIIVLHFILHKVLLIENSNCYSDSQSFLYIRRYI